MAGIWNRLKERKKKAPEHVALFLGNNYTANTNTFSNKKTA